MNEAIEGPGDVGVWPAREADHAPSGGARSARDRVALVRCFGWVSGPLMLALVVTGCGRRGGRDEADTVAGYVFPYNDDPDNFTSTGYPRHRYCACGRRIPPREPFEVVENGFGQTYVAVSTDYLRHRRADARPNGGIERSRRVGYNFPSMYRGTGMREWQAKGSDGIRALAQAARFMASAASRETRRGRSSTIFRG